MTRNRTRYVQYLENKIVEVCLTLNENISKNIFKEESVLGSVVAEKIGRNGLDVISIVTCCCITFYTGAVQLKKWPSSTSWPGRTLS